jgi:hypothetical protein
MESSNRHQLTVLSLQALLIGNFASAEILKVKRPGVFCLIKSQMPTPRLIDRLIFLVCRGKKNYLSGSPVLRLCLVSSTALSHSFGDNGSKSSSHAPRVLLSCLYTQKNLLNPNSNLLAPRYVLDLL